MRLSKNQVFKTQIFNFQDYLLIGLIDLLAIIIGSPMISQKLIVNPLLGFHNVLRPRRGFLGGPGRP